MPANNQLIVIAMGGTIDKDYDVTTASLEVADPFIAWLTAQLGIQKELPIVQLAQRDSLELKNADRDRLVEYIRESRRKRILITHGTDTLLETASTLARAIADGTVPAEITVVLTGAFRPGRFAPAEASFNIGFGLAIAQTANPGVYVATGSQYATFDRVTHTSDGFTYE